MPLRRDIAALIAVCSLFCAQGCYVYQRPRAGAVPEPGARVRVQSATPFAVRPVADAAVVAADCRATLIEGFATTASADTVTFQRVTRLVSANPDRASCRWTRTDPVVVATSGADVTLNRFSGKRTAVLLLVSFLAFAAYAVSQIEYPVSSGGDCAFC
jgi:hypothetical protein